MDPEISRQILEKFLIIKFHENRSTGDSGALVTGKHRKSKRRKDQVLQIKWS